MMTMSLTLITWLLPILSLTRADYNVYEYVVQEDACLSGAFISSAAECEAAANALGIQWNSCCQNNNNLPYGCLKRDSDNDVIWNGNADTGNIFPCSVAGNCDHGMRYAVCYKYDYVVTESACSVGAFIASAAECEAAANALGIQWNSCCQNNNDLPYGCLKRDSDNDVIWNGNAGTDNVFPCSVAGNCDHGMRYAVCYDIEDSVSEAQEKCCVDGWSQGTDCRNGCYNCACSDGSRQCGCVWLDNLDERDLYFFSHTATFDPSRDPTATPTVDPTVRPTADPTVRPTADPTRAPTTDPTRAPTTDPTREPTTVPTREPTEQPTEQPTVSPTTDLYLRVDELLSRDDADERCQELYGTRLASIHSQFQNDEAYELCARDRPSFTSGVFSGCWIGFYFDGEAQTIGWTDGSPVEFANWREGAPNNGAHNNFIKVNSDDSEWEDAASEIPASLPRFLCNAPSVETSTVSPSPETTFNAINGHYVAAGNPLSGVFVSDVAFSCEEDASNQARYESGFDFDIAVACCDDSAGYRQDCNAYPATYQEAVDECASRGYRLCTLQEMLSGKTKGKGCSFDNAYQWTSDECSVDTPASGDPARSIERRKDSGYDVIESGEQVMDDAAADSDWMAVLVASLAVVAVMAIALALFFVLRKKEVKKQEDMKKVAGHVPSSSMEMRDTHRPTAPVSV